MPTLMCAQVGSMWGTDYIANDVTDFPKVTWILSPPSCHLRFAIVFLETFQFKKKGLAM